MRFDYEVDCYLVHWNFDSKSGYDEKRFDNEGEAVAFANTLKGLVRVQEVRNVVVWYKGD